MNSMHFYYGLSESTVGINFREQGDLHSSLKRYAEVDDKRDYSTTL